MRVQPTDKTLLDVRNLKIYFHTDEGLLKAVDDVSFTIRAGCTLGLVGESGCGKSVTAQALLKIVPPPGVIEGQVLFQRPNGGPGQVTDIASLAASGHEIRGLRGKEISMIFQEPMTSFSPHYTMGNQLMEAVLLHSTQNKRQARHIAIDMLRKVGIANPETRIDEYPHQFSGGMRQRVMIAMALACNPALLIADEPTTALDVTIQAQVLDLMKALQQEFGMAILFITHDLAVVAEMCDHVAVMYLGKIVEYTTVAELFDHPLHPYSIGLLRSIPKIGKHAKHTLASIEGAVPVPLGLPAQCGFVERCDHAIKGLCDVRVPPLIEVRPGHAVRCFLFPEVRRLAEQEVPA
jgi:peptide/nickel transport system ATP-binding protein